MSDQRKQTILVSGAGTIGTGMAIVFALAGHNVRIWDIDQEALERSKDLVRDRLGLLTEHKMTQCDPATAFARIEWFMDLSRAGSDVDLVQECLPEVLSLKREHYRALAKIVPEKCVIASSTSTIPPGKLSEGLENASRFLVGHPANPPFLMPLVEIIVGPATEAWVKEYATSLYETCGLDVVHVEREIEGFIFNRLQGAMIREAYCLVQDQVASVADVDKVVRTGLAPRWCVTGPFETADLNVEGGIPDHANRFGEIYRSMGQLRGQDTPWTKELVENVTRQRREILPLDQRAARVGWRDSRLAAIRSALAKVFRGDGT